MDPLSVARAIAALNEQHAIEIETLRAKLDEAKREVERLKDELYHFHTEKKGKP
jgi:predicted RNase H-like nuclease (RuvC/YqgF family)